MSVAESLVRTGVSPQALPLRVRTPLADVCAANDIGDELRMHARTLGFVGCSYFAGFASAPSQALPEIAWSTHGSQWDTSYRSRALAHVDPRLVEPVSLAPTLWGYPHAVGAPPAPAFVRIARAVGLGSGVVVNLADVHHGRVVVAFDGGHQLLYQSAIDPVLDMLGDLMLLAAVMHEQVLRPRLLSGASRSHLLSPRQRACLALAARGLTSADIGHKLGISVHTANFHINNVIRILGALNRSEAIVMGMRSGFIDGPTLR
jgi:DNA-binding CsgD family transcriptional regulator